MRVNPFQRDITRLIQGFWLSFQSQPVLIIKQFTPFPPSQWMRVNSFQCEHHHANSRSLALFPESNRLNYNAGHYISTFVMDERQSIPTWHHQANSRSPTPFPEWDRLHYNTVHYVFTFSMNEGGSIPIWHHHANSRSHTLFPEWDPLHYRTAHYVFTLAMEEFT